ncbi:MAG: phosphatidylserine decarboxylase family protein [Anaerolineales bacterium]|nr:phosphatidylserine decarboxylase family protein [Anaerolineales bacterium]
MSDQRVPDWSFNKNKEITLLGSSVLLVMAFTALLLWTGWLSGIFFGIIFPLWCILFYFFRDPDRVMERSQDYYYSPGDGVVSDIETVQEVDYLKGDFVRIGIFLSIFDVHVQRAPMAGVVDFVTHQAGKNHPAYTPEASYENDQIIMGLDTSAGKILVKQISGILARKCYNYAKLGEQILSGQRYGLIKFGSRVELYLPLGTRVRCLVGEKVKGGITILAEIADE